ncbi:hypothetical protein [Krasilnikovia sp. M28-CT-15]|uniref:hypothetical protein n=1 Tax=Krasilnikovia sp. M28-CT-15 TaxID=3373540 RepID=UPI00399CE007
MPAVNVRAVFGHAAASLEGVRADVGVDRPAKVSQLADLYVRDVVFDEPIVTSDGIALGGHHTLTVRRDGSYRYQGYFRATGYPSYEVAMVTTLGYQIPVPGAQPGTGQLAFAVHGRVVGTDIFSSGDQEYHWDESGHSPLLQTQWSGVRHGQFQHRLEYDTDWFGAAGGVVNFVAQAVALGSTLGAAGVAIVVAGTAADQFDLEQLVIPGLVGIAMAGGAAYVFGPGAMFPAFLIGAVATAALIKQRHLRDEERAFADRVFRGRVPFDRVLLTNLVGLGGVAFTAPGPGGAILVNLGEGYENPTTYTGRGGSETGKKAPGQLLIHELTHAWQIANESFTPEYYCRALPTAVGSAGGDMSAYEYGPPYDGWRSFGTEAQASIVADWFGGSRNPDGGHQRGYPPMHDSDKEPNPYFRYIRDNIRTGIA